MHAAAKAVCCRTMRPLTPHVQPPPARDKRTEDKALASLVLGLSSLACLGALTGLPAIVLGALARRDIDRSEGRLGGSGVAAAGIVSGLFGTGIGIVAVLFVLGGAVELAQAPAPGEATPRSAARSQGALEVVDLEGEAPLHVQLDEVVRTARRSGRTVVLQTQSRDSARSRQISAALADHRMQRALADVTLVRVDVERFGAELAAMRVVTDGAPWFYKLDAEALPVDAMSSEELDTQVPEKMAAALSRFVRGRLRRR